MNGNTAFTVALATVVSLAVTIAHKFFSGGFKSGTVTQRLTSIEQAIIGMQSELKQMTSILVDIASVRGDIRAIEHRTERNEMDIRDLRRGRGFIQEEIKGEWPK